MLTVDQIAWNEYEAACHARYNHIYADRCELCWSGKNSTCQAWNQLSAQVITKLDIWLTSEGK